MNSPEYQSPTYPTMAQVPRMGPGQANFFTQPYGPQGQGPYQPYYGAMPPQGMAYAPQQPAPIYVEQQRGGPDGCCAGFLAALCCCCCMETLL